LTSAASNEPAGAVVFEDPLKERLAEGWTWIREDKTGWRVADGTLRVRLAPGNLWEKENTALNVLLRDAPKDARAFAAEVSVSHAASAFGEQAGLLWYRDDDNYIKLVKEFYDGKTWAVFAVERGGKADYREVDCHAEWVTFRLTVAGDKVSAAFRADGGADWKDMGTFDFPPRGNQPDAPAARIGLTAHHGPANPERWAHFRDFRITREK
jgi:regulation of enolase protein 1 (concanavalin A-like superfamily)